MNVTHHSSSKSDNGRFTQMRMRSQPSLPIPINYASAAIPTYAPYGTEYTPSQHIRIIGGRRIPIVHSKTTPLQISSVSYSTKSDPAVAPTKPIQNVTRVDSGRWQQPPKGRFDTTYRAEYINRLRNQEQYTKPTRHFKNTLNQYSVLPPISGNTNRNPDVSDRKSVSDGQPNYPDQEVPSLENMPQDDYQNGAQYYDQQQQQQPMMNNEDTYLSEEPVLLTDFEEARLAEQIRSQIGAPDAVERVKVFYQELAAYDPNRTGYIHYSQIQTLAYQLGLRFADDTLRFAMCKFVAPERGRGYVNYEDLIRFIGKCLSDVQPNQYGSRQYHHGRYWSRHSMYYDITGRNSQQERNSPQKQSRSNEDDQFDPDERQIRILLKQNLKHFDLSGTIDFDRLTNELMIVDRNQSGILNRQQIEEVVYKVRIPFQRSLIYAILEKHCRAYPRLYNWKAFVQYLKEQVFDLKQIQDHSSQIYSQYVPTRSQWLDDLQREFHERDRLRIIERFVSNNAGVRVESTHPTAWFTRFLRFANALYSHRTNSNVSQDYVLPREEARRLFRAYNHIWDLKLEENRIQRVFDGCSRNGHILVTDALKQLAN